MTKLISVKVVDVKHFVSCLDGSVITSVAFLDGKTLRYKEFRQDRNFEAGQKIEAEKIGSGKYAGYRF